eukprot:scaffold964_cov261-Pinguiococcus_pyrenoidosus.AAC.24
MRSSSREQRPAGVAVQPLVGFHHLDGVLQRPAATLDDRVGELRHGHSPTEARAGVSVCHVGDHLQRELPCEEHPL